MTVQLGKYKKLGFKRPYGNVKEEEINDYINEIREQYKIEVEKDGFIEKEDYITIDYNGYHEGVYVREISRKNYHLKIGEGFFLDEFEAHLFGKRRGDILKFELVLPNDYAVKYLRNETVHFEVKILSVTKRIIPKLTDDVVRTFKIEAINTIDELKEDAKNKVYYQKHISESTDVVNRIMHEIIENSKVKLNDKDIEHLKYEILEDFKKQLEKKNANLEIYLSHTKKTEEELLEYCKLEAKTYLTEKAIIEEIAKVENITLNDEERLAYNEEQDDLNQLLYQKVIRFLLRENTVIVK